MQTKRLRALRVLLPLVLCGLPLAPRLAVAQDITAAITGTVVDSSGAVLPGVTLTVVNTATGLTRAEVADARGRYRVLNLPIGSYEVRGELQGFQRSVRRGIELTIGREAVVDLTLQVGDLTEEVVVTGEAPLVDTSSGSLGGVVTEERITELPLNGRDLTQLMTLESGVTLVRRGSSDSTGGFGARMSISGARPDMVGWLLDGTDIQTTFKTGPAGAAGVQLGVEAVKEFRIMTSSYTAEYGTVAGGVVNSVTKSGTNNLHGSVFEFHRNDAFDARNFFDQNRQPPPFKRNQFGFSIGGPVVKNRTFFFGTYEGLRDRLTATQFANVPTADARRGILPGVAPITVNPAVVPWLALYPLPNGVDLGNGTGEYISEVDNPTDEDYVTARVDHSFSGQHSVYGRYTRDVGDKVRRDSIGLIAEPSLSRHVFGTIEGTSILNPRWLNKARFGYNRSFDADDFEPLHDLAALMLTPFPFPALISTTGFPALGLNTTNPRRFRLTQLEFANDMTVSWGAHDLKFGAIVKHIRFFQNQQSRAGGEFIFSSPADLLAGRARSFSSPLPGTDAVRNFRQNLFGFYVQDNLQVQRRLTLNLGVRYEFVTTPTEVDGKSGGVRNIMDPEATVGPLFKNPSLKNVAPRVGFAWDATGSGRTSVKGGFGIFYDQLLPSYWRSAAVRQPPFFTRGELRNPPIANPYAALAALGAAGARLDLTSIDYDIETPRLMQFNLAVQQQMGSTAMVQIGYSGSRGSHLFRAGEANSAVPQILPDGRQFFPANAQSRNLRWASDRRSVSDAHSFYNALLVSGSKRLGGGLQLQGSYTWGKSIDEASALFQAALNGEFLSIDFYDARRNRGLSLFDVRNNFVFNALWELPVARDAGGLRAALAGGWQLGGILTMQSGLPQTPVVGFNNSRNQSSRNLFEVPNLKPGASNNPVLGGADRYFDASVFELAPAGFYGDLGRNTLIGPGVVTVDASLIKNVALGILGEGARLQFRVETFNLLNRVNLGPPDVDPVLLADGTPDPSAGRIRTTSTTARQMQLGVKVMW